MFVQKSHPRRLRTFYSCSGRLQTASTTRVSGICVLLGPTTRKRSNIQKLAAAFLKERYEIRSYKCAACSSVLKVVERREPTMFPRRIGNLGRTHFFRLIQSR